MKCQECELLLADEQRTSEVEAHLGECAGCRSFARELRANFEALGEMRDDPLPIPKRRWRKFAMAAAAAIVVGLGTAHYWPRPEKTAIVTVRPAAPPVTVARREVAPAMPAARRRHIAPVKRTPDQQELLVKMETEDPEVVIYWLIQSENGPEKGQSLK
jgi:hypothetical protein